MPWSDAAGTGGRFGCRIGDYRVCLFELWPSKSSGSRASANYSSTLVYSCGIPNLKLLIDGGWCGSVPGRGACVPMLSAPTLFPSLGLLRLVQQLWATGRMRPLLIKHRSQKPNPGSLGDGISLRQLVADACSGPARRIIRSWTTGPRVVVR